MDDQPKFPYPYGSDLHWLWGWGYRIQDYLGTDAIPSESDWILYRPDELAANAMLRFSIDYPTVIEELRGLLAEVESAATALEVHRNELTEFRLTDAMDVLSRRIIKAAEIIAERENRTPDDKTDGKKNSGISLPENPDVPKLALLIRRNTDPKRTKTEIAREFTNNDEKRAQSLLRKLRDFPDLLNGT